MYDDEVVIKVRVDDSELEKLKGKGKEESVGKDSSTEVIEEITGNQGKDSMLDEAKAHGLIGGAMGGMGGIGGAKKGMGMAKGMANNPMGTMMQFFQNSSMVKQFMKFIPHVALIIMAVEIIPLVIKGIIDQLTAVGSPFDKRFKRKMQSEQNAFFNREEQKKRQLGLSPVIMTSITGFRNIGGYGSTWTLQQVRDVNGSAPIGLIDKATGLRTA
jgi:hypothetical protein